MLFVDCFSAFPTPSESLVFFCLIVSYFFFSNLLAQDYVSGGQLDGCYALSGNLPRM